MHMLINDIFICVRLHISIIPFFKPEHIVILTYIVSICSKLFPFYSFILALFVPLNDLDQPFYVKCLGSCQGFTTNI